MQTETALDLLKKYFGYSTFRRGQEELINALLSGQDVLGVMPTGAGKSICYEIPALMFDGITLVISPLISLMKDQVASLKEAGIEAAYINSSLNTGEYYTFMDNMRCGAYKIIYAAPERLEKLTPALRNHKLSFLVVDEVHCVSQWGHDFRPSYLKIKDFINTLDSKPVIGAFTATATERVREDIKKNLHLQDAFTLVTGFDRANLYFSVQKPPSRMQWLLRYLEEKKDKSGIIYCATRKGTEDVARALDAHGASVTRYHAGLEDRERRKNQDDFIYDRKNIMVATNAFGMGVDKSNVSFVVHYNMPKNIESYYQEAGRAGRDGEAADCVLLYSGEDVHLNKFLINQSEDKQMIEHNLDLLRLMTYYCTTTECLRSFILKYFGEAAPHYCARCSNCNTQFETVDITVDCQKIVSCVYRLLQRGKRFGKSMIIDILKGAKTKKIYDFSLDDLSTYGIMKETGKNRVRNIIDYLIDKEYLAVEGDFSVVVPAEKARTLISKEPPKIEIKLAHDEGKGEEEKRKMIYDYENEDAALFSRLRGKRAEIAQASHVPAYIIFSDASLHDMCRKMPRTFDEFLNISGVGKVKAEKYGAEFIDIIKERRV